MWCLHYIAELRQKKRKFSASTEISVDLARNAVLGNWKNVAGPLCDLKKAIRQIQFQVRRTLGMDSTKKPIVTMEDLQRSKIRDGKGVHGGAMKECGKKRHCWKHLNQIFFGVCQMCLGDTANNWVSWDRNVSLRSLGKHKVGSTKYWLGGVTNTVVIFFILLLCHTKNKTYITLI